MVLLLLGFGSLVVAEIEAVAVIEATVIVGARLTATMMFAESLTARLAAVQVIVPVAPTAGVVQVQPAGEDMEAKVVFVGTASVNVRLDAVPGPLFVMV